MKTFVIVVETAIISFFLGGMTVVYGQQLRAQQEAAQQETKENSEA